MIAGIGTDIIEVRRITRSINNQSFLDRVYSHREQELCAGKQSREQSLAARFAAKEAFMKALGTGWSEGVRFAEIEILSDNAGAPYIALSGASQKQADALGVVNIHVTLSHVKEMATATVILEK